MHVCLSIRALCTCRLAKEVWYTGLVEVSDAKCKTMTTYLITH